MAEVHGSCDPKFNNVRELLGELVASGGEIGAAVAVNIHGKDVVDIWAGHKDEARTEPWEEDTIVNVWSTTKTIASLAALMLMDRGLITPSTKVASVWPGFEAQGKEDIEVRMIMSHTSGLPGWSQKVSLEDIYDVEKCTAMLAEQAPWWEPGTASGYHVYTHGHLIAEVVRRTTGKTFTKFVAEEIAGPLGADFQVGCAEQDFSRTATLKAPPPFDPALFPEIDMTSIAMRALFNPAAEPMPGNDVAWRRAEISGANGHTNARALVKILKVITLGGEVNGTRFLKPETIDLIFKQQALGMDQVLGVPVKFGIGYGLAAKDTSLDWFPHGRTCLWLGYGGSIGLMDLENGLTMSYTMNRMGEGVVGSDRTRMFVKAVYKAIGIDV